MARYDVFKKLCDEKGLKPGTVGREIGISTATISSWKNGKYSPKTDKLQKIADYFGVTVDYLMTGTERTDDRPYYLDDEAREYAQFLYDNPEYRVLFDASRSVKKEDIGFVKDMIDRLTKS